MTARKTPARVRGLVVLAGLLGVAGCGSASFSAKAADEAVQHATNAGVAMINAPPSATAAERASRVVGASGDTRIELVSATGDRAHGQVVLRIRVHVDEQGFTTAGDADDCFRYTFRSSIDDDHAVRLPSCPAAAVAPG